MKGIEADTWDRYSQQTADKARSQHEQKGRGS
mgnify:CR=1 FL=1